MARKKTAKPMTTDEFREIERRSTEGAGKRATERLERERAKTAEEVRRRALASRSMREIVESMMSPPENVRLPSDFATAWATDRSMFLRLIDRRLSAEETKAVACAMATLMDHNRRLRLLAKDLVTRLEDVSSAVKIIRDNTVNRANEFSRACIAGEGYIDIEDD